MKLAILFLLAAVLGSTRMPEAAIQTSPDLRAAMDTRIDLDARNVTLRAALARVTAAVRGLALTIDPSLGPDSLLDTLRVDLAVPRIRAEDAVRLILSANPSLRLVTRSDGILVTTSRKVQENLVTTAYPVDGLLQMLEKNKTFQATVEADRRTDDEGKKTETASDAAGRLLAEFVMGMVSGGNDPDLASWGGPGDGRAEGRSLVVRQTERGHQEVRCLLDAVRRTFAQAGDRKAEGPPEETEDVAAVRRLLAKKIDVDFRAVTPKAALGQLCKQTAGLVVVRHPLTKGDLAEGDESRFDFKARQVPVGAVLDLLLPVGWQRRAERGYVLVGEDLGVGPMPLRAYPLGDPPAGAPTTAGQAVWPMWDLKHILMQIPFGNDSPFEMWIEESGSATIASLGDVFFVVQTPTVHRRIAAFLGTLAQATATRKTAQSAPSPTAEEAARASPALDKLLAARIDADFENEALPGVLGSLESAHAGLHFLWDPRLRAEGVRPADHFVNVDVVQVPLAEVLMLLQDDGPKNRLYFQPWCGYILVTANPLPRGDLPVAVYPVADLQASSDDDLDSDGGLDALVMIIKQTINATSDPRVAQWSDEGGPACIMVLDRMLCVTQTEDGHRQVAELLEALREEKKWWAAEEARQKAGGKPRALLPPGQAPEPPHRKDPLAEVVEINVSGASMEEALKAVVRQCPDLAFEIDRSGLSAKGIDLAEMKVTFRGRATAREVLDKILGPDLGYRLVGGGRYQVAAFEAGAWSLPVVTYPVGETLCGPYAQAHPAPAGFRPAYDAEIGDIDYDELIKMLRKAVNHQADPDVAEWSEDGWPVVIHRVGGCLVVSQTRQGHRKIMEFLQDLFKKRFP
jgi:hypothetical protein